jgi:transposase InsO family protein
MRKTAEQIEALREQAVLLWQEGTLTITDIAKRLNVSRKFVYTTIERFHKETDNPFLDKRRGNGRPRVYESLNEIVLDIRTQHPDWGPVMICHYLEKHRDQYNLNELPTPRTISLAIRELGLARKHVGPKDRRLYPDPDARPEEPGTITIDLWGPWRCRASKLYLVTAMDRFSRMAVAAPASSIEFGQEIAPGVSVNTWIHAIVLAIRFLLPPGVNPKTLYVDNGVGLVPIFGSLTKALRFALSTFGRVVFIPPAQPWRNGRLERFHWTLEREFFARERPSRLSDAITGLVEYLNWYNRERPHTALQFRSPIEMLGPSAELPLITTEALVNPVRVAEDVPLVGHVELIRMVEDKGRLTFFQESDSVYLPDVLAGQYVRVQLFLNGTGRVLWQRKKGDEPIVVADLAHHLGQRGSGSFVTQLIPREFGYDVPGNMRVDWYAYEQSKLRRYKKAPTPSGDSE